MDFKVFGKEGAPTLLLIPGLGVSYEIFLPLIDLLKDRFLIIAVQVDGFTLGVHTRFTSIDDQARQVITHVKERYGGRLDCAYGLSLGGKILSRVLERDEVVIVHAILDAAALLPVLQRMDLLSLDGILAVGVPLALFRRTAGRMQKGISIRRRTCRLGRLQIGLYQ